MLTDSENAWLADRKKDRLFVCRFCPGREYGREMTDTGVPCVCHCMSLHIRPECYKLHKGTGWDDAALFEARVAAKLATLLDESYFHIDTGSYESCREVCPAHSLCPKGLNPDCRTTFVKYARLMVEEEMNAD